MVLSHEKYGMKWDWGYWGGDRHDMDTLRVQCTWRLDEKEANHTDILKESGAQIARTSIQNAQLGEIPIASHISPDEQELITLTHINHDLYCHPLAVGILARAAESLEVPLNGEIFSVIGDSGELAVEILVPILQKVACPGLRKLPFFGSINISCFEGFRANLNSVTASALVSYFFHHHHELISNLRSVTNYQKVLNDIHSAYISSDPLKCTFDIPPIDRAKFSDIYTGLVRWLSGDNDVPMNLVFPSIRKNPNSETPYLRSFYETFLSEEALIREGFSPERTPDDALRELLASRFAHTGDWQGSTPPLTQFETTWKEIDTVVIRSSKTIKLVPGGNDLVSQIRAQSHCQNERSLLLEMPEGEVVLDQNETKISLDIQSHLGSVTGELPNNCSGSITVVTDGNIRLEIQNRKAPLNVFVHSHRPPKISPRVQQMENITIVHSPTETTEPPKGDTLHLRNFVGNIELF